jgi:Leucine-rich repeat (LRR) protein
MTQNTGKWHLRKAFNIYGRKLGDHDYGRACKGLHSYIGNLDYKDESYFWAVAKEEHLLQVVHELCSSNWGVLNDRWETVALDSAIQQSWAAVDLTENLLTRLPDVLSGMKLVELNLNYNQLETLHPSIGCQAQLKTLYLQCNLLKKLPDTFTCLLSLKVVWLNNNKLTVLPEDFGLLTGITSLNLSNNCLETLPDSLSELTKLNKLYINDNQLSKLPASIRHLTRLSYLCFHHNRITTLEKCELPVAMMNVFVDKSLEPSMNFGWPNLYFI